MRSLSMPMSILKIMETQGQPKISIYLELKSSSICPVRRGLRLHREDSLLRDGTVESKGIKSPSQTSKVSNFEGVQAKNLRAVACRHFRSTFQPIDFPFKSKRVERVRLESEID